MFKETGHHWIVRVKKSDDDYAEPSTMIVSHNGMSREHFLDSFMDLFPGKEFVSIEEDFEIDIFDLSQTIFVKKKSIQNNAQS